MSELVHLVTSLIIAITSGVTNLFIQRPPETPVLNQRPALSTTTANVAKPRVITPDVPKQAKATSTTSSTVPKTKKPKTLEVTVPVAVISSVSSSSPSSTTPPMLWDTVNEKLRAAVVNVFCTSAVGGLFSPISGSGVIIDPRGVILTNAHVAQYFLIKDYPSKNFLDCVIRQGSPATAHYRAELLYISPTWVATHYQDILKQENVGTGENDFALLLITGTTNPSAQLPTPLPYLPPETTLTPEIIGNPVLIAAYPAGFLGGASIQTGLFLSSAPAVIETVYTFGTSTPDLVSLGGSVVAQRGSSGGAVTGGNGNLMGIIVTTSEAVATAQRELHAITVPYIGRRLKEESGVNLITLISGNVSEIAQEFNQLLAPSLTELLVRTMQQSAR